MNDDSERAIGRLEGKLDSLIETVKKQGENSDDSRRRLYERVGKIETSVEIGGKIDAQVRTELDALNSLIQTDVMPTIKNVNNWERMGMGALAVIGVGGAAIGGFVFWAWDVIWSKIHL